jgi:membrane fusion protein (multidrug efflux system)
MFLRSIRLLKLASPLCIGLALTLAGCDKPAPPPPPAPPEVKVIKVEPRDTLVTFEYIGQSQSPQQVNIVARVNGFLDRQFYTEGAEVKPGQMMFQMDRKPFQAQLDAAKAAQASAKAAHDNAAANLKRVRPLAELNALSQKDLDDAKSAFDTTAASLAQAGANVQTAQLNLSYTTIASPLRGVAGAAQQKVGTFLNPQNSQLTTVSSLNPMWVNFSLSENELTTLRNEVKKGLLRAPAGGKFVAEAVMVDGSTFPHTGTISFVDPSFNSQTGTFLIRVTLDNPAGQIRPNQYIRVRLKGAVRPNAVAIPQRAVQQGSKGHFVWVVDKDGKAENRPVAVGDWYGDQWFINDGLVAGDQVVVDGGLRVRAGAMTQPTPVQTSAPTGPAVVDKSAAGAGKPTSPAPAAPAAAPASSAKP